MKNNSKIIIVLLIVIIAGVVGLTIAYFSNQSSFTNTFITDEYGTTVTQTFTSPENWLPGDTTNTSVIATNTKSTPVAVKVTLSEEWKAANNSTLTGWVTASGNPSAHENNEATDVRATTINFTNISDWIYYDGAYYYKYKLEQNDSTPSLVSSVTFNSIVNASSNCVTTTGSNNESITTCSSSNAGYANATYKLIATIETVQADKYLEHWQVTAANVNIVDKP